jgi:2-polyprenyl-3-methyl-5-hydroxy-6-metoxy-1,4-benzoquinol methylase
MECPVCLNEVQPKLVETHIDPIENKEYKIYSCPNCEVEFSEPMKSATQEYQIKVDPQRKCICTKKLDWRFKMFFKHMPLKKGKILDIGCGCGSFLLAAQKKGYTVWGIDMDNRMIEIGKKWGVKNILVASFEQYYKTTKQKFDIITLFDVLEHIENPNVFLVQIKELLYPNGYIVITVPNSKRPILTKREDWDYPPRHLTRWTKKSLINFLESYGFIILYSKVSPIFPSNIFTNLHAYYMPKIVRFMKTIFTRYISTRSCATSENFSFSAKRVSKIQFLSSAFLKQKILSILPKAMYYVLLPFMGVLSAWFYLKKLKNLEVGQTLFVIAHYKNNTISS